MLNSNTLHRSEDDVEADIEALGQLIATRLVPSADQLPYDITERLRAARVQAVEKRKQVLRQSATVWMPKSVGALSTGRVGGTSSWWNRLGAVGLLLVLAVGLLLINVVQDDIGTRELADIDAALLTDDLPPAAYVDAGFAQFLKVGYQQEPL